MVKRFAAILIVFISLSALAQEVKVTASTDKTDYLIGDYIRYSLVIDAQKNVFIINPFFRDSLRNIDVVNISDPIITENEQGKTVKYEATLSRYDSAQVTLPPIKVEYRTKNDTTLKSVLSNSVTFNVHSVKVSLQEEIKDIKPPIRLWDYFFLIFILIAIIIIVIGYFIYRKYKNKKEIVVVKKEKEKILAHQLALRKLDQLEKEQLWQKGFVKEYHTRITEIIREYFEIQFELPALELTTTESLKLLSKHSLGIKVLDLTAQFLSNADLVKFAKYEPLEKVNHEMMEQAREIVTKTMSAQKEIVIETEPKEAANV
jgi:hypothetical protein